MTRDEALDVLGALIYRKGSRYAEYEAFGVVRAEFARLLAIEARAIRMRDDNTQAPGWSVRQANARVILGEP